MSSGKTLAELRADMVKLPQVMVNVRLDAKVDVMSDTRVVDAVSEAEGQLSGRGRVLLRPSGTEPLIRVMVESDDEAQTEKWAEHIAEIVRKVAN